MAMSDMRSKSATPMSMKSIWCLCFVPLALEHHRRAVRPAAICFDIDHLARMPQRLVGEAVPQPVAHGTVQGGSPVGVALPPTDRWHMVLIGEDPELSRRGQLVEHAVDFVDRA